MRIKFDTDLTIFALFFGVSLLEAIQTGNLLKSLFWLAIGVVFLLADTFRRRPA